MEFALAGSPDNLRAQQVTIASGASASEMIPTQGMALIGVLMPSAWTAANIGYKACLSGRPNDLVTAYDGGGIVLQTPAAASRFLAFPLTDAIFAPFLQIVSVDPADGTTPVNQGAERSVVLLFRRFMN